MMASEATPEKPADAPASTSPRPVNIETTHDVDPKASVNGTEASADIANKRITSVEEQTLSTDVSVSGGSDTEGPKSDSAKRVGDRSHARVSSSVKKPATFKAVSVNKTFLASKGGFSAASSKSAEKVASTPTASTSQLQSGLAPNRPRLVAKTGVGSRDSVPRLSANGGKPGTAPDPNTVWNKNRPAPTPEPKKLSDEELKKYGIHMANRLHSEDTKGQSNWADIDDDDDDWAPEAITWTDGTKSTLPAADDSESPGEMADIRASAETPVNEKLASEKAKALVPSRTASPTVRSSGIPSGKGLILKAGSAEKVTLVAKPPAPPTPAKSPWAPLPPIQKAPPVSTDPPVGRNSSRPPARDSTHFRPGAREISADDFSRSSSWRDGLGSSNRELYNSQSGRYEPVTDRRGSFRADLQARPSLLQRPNPYHHGSGEPSPTFQPARPIQDGQFGRRRGSSNVSGGSGYLNRAGKAYEPSSMPPPEMLNTRRPSVTASIDSHISPRNFSPSEQYGGRLQSGHAWQPRASPSMAHATPHYAHPGPEPSRAQAVPGMPLEDQVVEQQTRLMREKREQAIKRRQEEEAREEAAKAERIRLKLEAMGPPPERKSARKEAQGGEKAPVTPIAATPSGTQTAEPSTGQPQVERIMPSSFPPQNAELAKDSASQAPPDKNQPNPWDSSSQPRQEKLTWPSSTQQPSRNVWGSPNNDRGLGNGTFDPDLGRIPESRAAPLTQPHAKGPTPIAPPNAPKAPSRPQAHVYPSSRSDGRYASAPAARQYNETQNQWVNAVRQGDAQLREKNLKERAELDQRLADEGMTYEQAQPTIKQTWRGPSSMKTETAGTKAQGLSWEPTLEEQAKVIKAARDASLASAGPSAILAPSASTSSQSRPSRFFPPKDKDTAQSEPQGHREIERPKSPSPPPPTMDGHPVYDGDASHPQVSLPRPQPVVKLPPAPGAASAHGPPRSGRLENPWQGAASHKAAQVTATTPQAIHLPTNSHTPHSQQDWQKKIYELTGRRSVPKSPAVESSSRGVLDHDVDHRSAAVSLPGPVIPADAGEVTSKDSTNECFEEPEMGSLPLIRLPHKAPYADWSPPLDRPIKPLPRNLLITPVSVKYVDETPTANHVRVSLPGMPDPRVVNHDFGIRGDSRPSGQLKQGGRSRGPGSSYRGGGGNRKDSSSTYEFSGMQRGASPPAHRGRNTYRGRSEAWPRRSGHQAN